MKSKDSHRIGSRGLTGGLLLAGCWMKIAIQALNCFPEKPPGTTALKVNYFSGIFFSWNGSKRILRHMKFFCCIGATSAKTKDRAVYRAIDFGIPFAAARLAKVQYFHCHRISSMGANVKSKVFYSRTKGEMEQAVLDQAIPHTYILRPSLILGERNEKRLGEAVGAVLLKLSHLFLIGNLKKYRAIKADCIAAAMISIAKTLPELQIVNSDLIQEFGGKE